MKVGNNSLALVALFALLLASSLFLAGCVSSKYVPCCVKDGIYDAQGNPLGNPTCIFQNGSSFGGDCLLDPDVKNAAACSDGVTSCESLKIQDQCEKTFNCIWNPVIIGSNCTANGTGPARWVLPVCSDMVPKSCVNDRCMAMMCGYSNIRPSPPPASSDWDANKTANQNLGTGDPGTVIPANDMQMPSIGLQGLTCDFNAMNQKLYNKVKSSRGALWVNSFRFGVGSSFGDYEASKYFFPTTDKVCASNPSAKVDRFTVYLNYTETYCQKSPTYFVCKKNGVSYLPGLAWSSEVKCQLYCGGGSAPYACVQVTDYNNRRYICNEDGFAYENQTTCKLKCSIISNPNLCANNETAFPFLDTQSGRARYRMKMVSDVMVDTASRAPGGSEPCVLYRGPTGSYGFLGWRIPDEDNEAIRCDDFAHDWPPPYGWTDGPWFWTYPCNATYNDWTNCHELGTIRTYMDNHAYSALDFDYDYYKKELLSQYPEPDQDGRLTFECESGSDCLSGSCDTSYYKRPMCKNVTNGLLISCQCSAERVDDTQAFYPTCQLDLGSLPPSYTTPPAYSNTGLLAEHTGQYIVSNPINSNGPLFLPEQSWHFSNGSATTRFAYYFPAVGAGQPKPKLFEICGVPATYVQACVMHDKYCYDFGDGEEKLQTTDELIIKESTDNKCHYYAEDDSCWDEGIPQPSGPKNYWKYEFTINNDNVSKPVNAAHLGTCKLNGKIDNGQMVPAAPPYLDIKNLGWCAGCTYATLAVQKVSWGNPNPGGQGTPRALSCYEYRGEFNYVPGSALYGGNIGEAPGQYSQFDGILRWGSTSSPSTEPVRKTSNPAAYQRDTDGNLWQGENADNAYQYYCMDQWHANNGWWQPNEIPTPSAPYLKEKLTSYLQSNIMPILDEVSENTMTKAVGCTLGRVSVCRNPKPSCGSPCTCSFSNCLPPPPFTSNCVDQSLGYTCPLNPSVQYGFDQTTCNNKCSSMSDINKGYNPLSICNTMGGDGGVVHVIGNSHMLVSGGNLGTVVPSALSIDMRNYLGWQNTPDTQPIQLGSTAEDGKRAILVRTDLLKKQCKTPPLIGIEILEGDASTGSLIGTGDLADPNNPSRGSLHRLFFSNAPQHLSGFASRVKRGTPDKPADDVDILMHDWYPMCQGTGTLPGEKEVSEIELRIDLARALMGNFSKPSLIWKFGFPSNSMCNKTFFLDYLFNQTALMVDSGIIGIIYSDWMTRDGLPYGPPTKSYIEPDGAMVPSTVTLNTGMTDARTTKRGDPTYLTTPLDDPGVGRGSLFCAMQAFSKRVIGYTSLTYGQKIYAENKTCFCDPCTSYDYITGVCDREALIAQNNDPNLPQLYCNDGHTCTMPVDEQSRSPIPYSQYKCESRCLNETACKLCNSSTYLSSASFCRISTPNSPASGYSLPYNQINDYNWEFLAGLSPQEKCCLQSTGEGLYGTEYTYTTMTGTKQQSEFLQFPKRGEADIDCGRVPDTSVLEFCGVRVPISQKEIACMKINNPVNPINIQQIETGYSYD